MKFFKKYLFPPLFGLVVYFTVRVLHDTEQRMGFWHRPLKYNITEITASIIVGYFFIWFFKKLIKLFNKQSGTTLSYKNMIKELFTLIIFTVILINIIFIPIDAFMTGRITWSNIAQINIIPILYAIVYYFVVRSADYLKAYIQNQLIVEKISLDHLQTELKFLRAQYHPHFLFNALNTIYFQMDENIPDAKKNIEKLSRLLRYQLYDQQQKVSIIGEAIYILNYIQFQQTRLNEKLNLSINYDKQLNNKLIYPLLFLPIIENAFKYIGGNYIMQINADLKEDRLYFQLKNSFITNKEKASDKGGIGLENLKRRLELLYPGTHQFNTQINDFFTVDIYLPVDT